MSKTVATILLASTVILAAPAAPAAAAKALDLETIFLTGLLPAAPSQVRWRPGGRHLSYFLAADAGGRDLWLLDLASGAREILVPTDVLARLAPSPAQATRDERERTRRTRYHVPDYHWSPDGQTLLFTSAGRIMLHRTEDGATRRRAPSKDGVRNPRFSPDGKWIAFVHGHDLWVVPVAEGAERQVTFGGSATLLHGELDWVYAEELGVRGGFRWSPDSRHIIFRELDESGVPTYPIVEELGLEATADWQRYPKAGDPNPRVRTGIVNVHTTHTAWLDRGAEYVARIGWADAGRAFVQLLNRAQDELELLLVDPASGRSRSLLVERDPHWVDVTDDLHFLPRGQGFLWTSARSGLRQIYLYDDQGRLVRPLTRGVHEVVGIEAVDEARRQVYYSAREDNPLGSDLYRLSLSGGNPQRLTVGAGTHAVNVNVSAGRYLDKHSSLLQPPRHSLHTLEGDGRLEIQPTANLDEYELVVPEMITLLAANGGTVRVLLLKPRGLPPGQKRPLVTYVYGMAGVPTIRDAWGAGRSGRYLFHQFLVQQGYVVAYIDDSSSAWRGHKHAVRADHNVGPLAAADHALALQHLGRLPFVDGERTAVWGWSGGGYSTAYHLTHDGPFKVGIAVAPVTDWRLYDSIYTERYMGRPQDEPALYDRTSAVKAAGALRGHLLLIHGSHDDNVHPQNTFQLVHELVRAGKRFDLMIYPNKTHGLDGATQKVHLYRLIFDYLERQL